MDEPPVIELTPQQEQQMLDFWNQTPSNPPSLTALTSHIFGKDCDGRSKEARAVKKSLSKHNLRARAATDNAAPAIELSDAHKAYITNNAQNMNALEMAKILFANPSLTNLHAETRAVNEYIKTLDVSRVGSNPDSIPAGDYEPPKTLDKVLRKVNSYINGNLEKEKISASQKKGLETLIGYLQTYRFVRQMNTFDHEDDRKSFEDAFIRYTYDKPDLSQEELDQYIMLASEVVLEFKTKRRHEHLQQMLDDVTGNSPEDARITMGLVESIGKASTELHQCADRQRKLLDDLKEKRSAKLSKQIKDNASILNLVQMWKEEEGRKKWLKLAELEQKAVSDEVEKMSSISELKARILGLTKDEIKYGS